MTLKEFKLPDLGEGLTESEILQWKVAVGDTVELNQVIAEVETAKAVVELPSPYAGTIAILHQQPGTVVEVGTPIVSFTLPGDSSDDTPSHTDNDAPPKRTPTLVGYGAEIERTGRPTRKPRKVGQAPSSAAPHVSIAEEPPSVSAGPASSPERPRSTPPVRKLARDAGVDLASLVGTGPHGVITRADVDAAAKTVASSQLEGAQSAGVEVTVGRERETRTPIKGVRKHTAAAMVASAFTAPHVTEFLTTDVTTSMELLAQLKTSREFSGHKLTPLTLVAKAVLFALRRNPSLNSRWDESHQEIVQFNYVNLGIAAATPRGLTVPNVKDADRMGLLELSAALKDLAETARSGKTSQVDLSGGTFSITNIGIFGIDAGTPILNPGEAAILAVGSVRRQPWEHNGEIALRSVMTLSLSFDHRLVDGEQGSRFLSDVGAIMSNPGVLITMV